MVTGPHVKLVKPEIEPVTPRFQGEQFMAASIMTIKVEVLCDMEAYLTH